MRINTNINAITSRNSLFSVNRDLSKTIQKLSTGLRINSAADDAAGLGISENLRTQVRGMAQALKNTQDSIALLTIADGALNEQATIMQRMRELVIQAKNDTYTQTERDYMGQEFNQLMKELDRIAACTTYNGMTLFAIPEQSGNNTNGIYTSNDDSDPPQTAHKLIRANVLPNGGPIGSDDEGSGHHFNMMIGQNYTAEDAAAYVSASNRNYYNPNAQNMLTIAFAQMDSNTLFHLAANNAVPDMMDGDGYFGDFSWDPLTDPGDIMINAAFGGNASVGNKLDLILKLIDGGKNIDAAVKATLVMNANNPTGLDRINRMRAYIGAMINRLEHTVNNLLNQEANTQAAETVIRDSDFAAETASYTRSQILSQSSMAMLAQANTLPQAVLQLLR